MDRFADYSWYVKGDCINTIIKQIYEKNVYISKIDTPVKMSMNGSPFKR
jgi:hypothetical protein